MKVTLQRTVMSDVDILLDKQLRPQNAESFFYEVASNLTKKGFVSCKRDSSNGREIWRFKFNGKYYILSLY